MVKKTKEHREKMQQRKEKKLKLQECRTQEERRFETLNIIYQLKQNGLTSSYPAVKTLLEKLDEYVKKEETIEINIPFPERNKVIKGKLPICKSEEAVVMLKHIE